MVVVIYTHSGEFPFAYNSNSHQPRDAALSNLQSQLHRVDYTASDFETLIKSIIRRELLKLKEQDYARYAQLIRDMTDSQSDVRKLSKSLYTLTGSCFHNSNDAFEFEGAVPAVVPETALLHFN